MRMTAEDVLRLHTDRFNRARQQQDYAALEEIYSERYMLVRPDGSVLNKEQVLRDLREQGLTFHRIDLEAPVIRFFGFAAILTADSKTTSSRNGKNTHMRTSGLLPCMLRRVTRSGWSTFRARCSRQGPQPLQTRRREK
jgi:hypothetical protein